MRGHETRDISVRGVAWLAVGVIVSALIMHALLAWLFWAYSAHFEQNDRRAHANIRWFSPRQEILPPAYPLEIDSGTEAASLKQKQRAELNAYGWTDRSRGGVKIPIDIAMDLVVERYGKQRGRHE